MRERIGNPQYITNRVSQKVEDLGDMNRRVHVSMDATLRANAYQEGSMMRHVNITECPRRAPIQHDGR